jgi:transposase
LRQAPAGFDSLLADTGYDSDAIRDGVMQQGGTATIPANPSRAQKPAFDKHLYGARHVIENLFCKLKHNRAVATRYDKLQRHYLAMIHLACLRVWLFH